MLLNELKCKIISWFIIKYKFIIGELIRKMGLRDDVLSSEE